MYNLDVSQQNSIRLAGQKELIRRFVVQDNVLEWAKLLFPHKFSLNSCIIHDYFVNIMYNPFSVTLAPRGTAKTTVGCFLIPLYIGLNYPTKYRYYLNVQDTTTKGINVNNSIKFELENNELLREYYGDLVGDKWTEKLFTLKNGVSYGGLGVGESARGINVNNIRPDYIVLDDLYNQQDKYNILSIKKKNNWFKEVLYQAKAKDGCIHLQGTAIHKLDLLHQLQANPGVAFNKFKAINEDNSVIWPEYKSYEELMADKEVMGSSIFNAEMQNEVRDDETSLIKEAWIKFYDEISSDEDIVGHYLGVDPSIGEKEGSDCTGMAVIIQTKLKGTDSTRWYIRDIVNERLTVTQRINTIVTLNAMYNFKTVHVEAISGFKDFYNELRRTTNIPCRQVSSVRNKLANLEGSQSKFEHGKVFIYSGLAHKKKECIIEQLVNNYPEHDDLRDAILLCLNYSVGGKIGFMVV